MNRRGFIGAIAGVVAAAAAPKALPAVKPEPPKLSVSTPAWKYMEDDGSMLMFLPALRDVKAGEACYFGVNGLTVHGIAKFPIRKGESGWVRVTF
jgi:hypothetical protein